MGRLHAGSGRKKLAAKETGKTGTVMLNQSLTIVLTEEVKNDSLYWNAPAGYCKVIAFWSKPQGEKTMAATPTQVPVVNHLDSTKVLKSYKHLFGTRTGLKPFFGSPCVLFLITAMNFWYTGFTPRNFIAYFKKHRGYDITPWLRLVN